ncbi:MAG: hypothetical protein NC085_01680 [Muribaculaceae bacterium]|nr:hypothetical protein [Muribaculaceae bacterium]
MKKIKIFALFLTAVLLCSCSAKETVTETEITTETTAEDNSRALVRPWLGSELLDSIFYCGEYRPLPIAADENADLENLPEILYFENGSAEAMYDDLGNVVGLRFERNTAPSDFSVYGIDFTSRPEDIPEKVGIADSVYSGGSETIYDFYGGGITELTFVFEERSLVAVYIEV